MSTHASRSETAEDLPHANTVTLVGRLAAAPEPRELPSGDLLLTFRVVVDRPPTPGRQRRQVDTIDCAAWSGRVQRTVRPWEGGQTVMVEGHLRRRFRRTAGGPVSRVEVEVTRARRVRQQGAAG
jgi:single-strand DNA-binding protein